MRDELAVDERQGAKVGTAIELRESPERKHEQLAYHHLAPADSDVSAAARLLEILLDRIAWRCQISGDGRGAYLLDPEYEREPTEDDRAVREALLQLQAAVAEHTNSAGHEAITSLLQELGLPVS